MMFESISFLLKWAGFVQDEMVPDWMQDMFFEDGEMLKPYPLLS